MNIKNKISAVLLSAASYMMACGHIFATDENAILDEDAVRKECARQCSTNNYSVEYDPRYIRCDSVEKTVIPTNRAAEHYSCYCSAKPEVKDKQVKSKNRQGMTKYSSVPDRIICHYTSMVLGPEDSPKACSTLKTKKDCESGYLCGWKAGRAYGGTCLDKPQASDADAVGAYKNN